MVKIEKVIKVDSSTLLVIGWYVFYNDQPILAITNKEGEQCKFAVYEYFRPDIKKIAIENRINFKKACGFAVRLNDTSQPGDSLDFLILNDSKIVKQNHIIYEYSNLKDFLDYLSWLNSDSLTSFKQAAKSWLGDIFRKTLLYYQKKINKIEIEPKTSSVKSFKNIVLINFNLDNIYFLEAQLFPFKYMQDTAIIIGVNKIDSYQRLAKAVDTLNILFPNYLYTVKGNAFNADLVQLRLAEDATIFYYSSNSIANKLAIDKLLECDTGYVLSNDIIESPIKNANPVLFGVLKADKKIYKKITNNLQALIFPDLVFNQIVNEIKYSDVPHTAISNAATYSFGSFLGSFKTMDLAITENRYLYLLGINN